MHVFFVFLGFFVLSENITVIELGGNGGGDSGFGEIEHSNKKHSAAEFNEKVLSNKTEAEKLQNIEKVI
jgi:hypothetical protein